MYLNTVPDRYGRTDRQTDRQTDGRLTVASPRSALASRGKNTKLKEGKNSAYLRCAQELQDS